MTQHTCDWTTPDAREWLRALRKQDSDAERLWLISWGNPDGLYGIECCEGTVGDGLLPEDAGYIVAMSEALPQLLDRLDELEDVLGFQLTIIGKQAIEMHQQAAEIERLNKMLADISKAIGDDIERANKRHQEDIAQDVICESCRERRIDTGALIATRCPGCQRGWCAKVYELPEVERKPKMIAKTSGPLTMDDEPGTTD